MDEKKRELLRQRTVSVLLAVRNEYLNAGANPLKHWDQIQDRLRAAARTSADVPGWITALSRSLNLTAPSRARCSATEALQSEASGCASEWLDLVEAEHGYLMAMAMLEADKKRAARAAEKEAEWAARAAEVDAQVEMYKQEEDNQCNSADSNLF